MQISPVRPTLRSWLRTQGPLLSRQRETSRSGPPLAPGVRTRHPGHDSAVPTSVSSKGHANSRVHHKSAPDERLHRVCPHLVTSTYRREPPDLSGSTRPEIMSDLPVGHSDAHAVANAVTLLRYA
ncbi:unnamed protein product, partial [Iphiclides podalirius]